MKTKLLVSFGLFLHIWTFAIGLYCSVVPRETAESRRSRAQAELPISTPRPQVEMWLKNRGVTFWHNTCFSDGRRAGLCGEFSVTRLIVFQDRYVYFDFIFDEQDLLTSLDFKDVFSGM